MIEVFVRSASVYMDVGGLREASQHTYCSPGTAAGLVNSVASKLKGRMLTQDDYTVLERIDELAHELHDKVRVFDISSVKDRVKALRRGVLNTPTVIVRGKKYEGLDTILELLP